MTFTEENLKYYAEPISTSENEKCQNALKMVIDALNGNGYSYNNYYKLLSEHTNMYGIEMNGNNYNRKIKIFIQGSYANNTNIKRESDIDIAIILDSCFIAKYPEGKTNRDYGNSTSDDNFSKFKSDIYNILVNKFGNDVKRGNKSININGNTYRVNIDVIPSIRYKDYTFNNNTIIQEGILIYSDNNETIINYPEQHIEQGKIKNVRTNFNYKKMVRIIKKIKLIMEDNSITSCKMVSSFGLESLLWNIPNEYFVKSSKLIYRIDDIINYLDKYSIADFKEANGIKRLFNVDTEVQYYRNFINDLKSFYKHEI